MVLGENSSGLTHHPDKGRRATLTHLTLIAGFASTIFWPLTGWLVEVLGWRSTYAAFAALHLLVALPLHAWIAARPPEGALADAGQEARHEFGPPLDGRAARLAFWALAVSFALSGVLSSGLAVHLVPVLQALELGAAPKRCLRSSCCFLQATRSIQ